MFYKYDINLQLIEVYCIPVSSPPLAQGATVLLAYSALLLVILPVVIEQQSYFAVAPLFWTALGISWGAAAALRARIRVREARDAGLARLHLSRRTASQSPSPSQAHQPPRVLFAQRTYSQSDPLPMPTQQSDSWSAPAPTRSTNSPSDRSSCASTARRFGLSFEVAAVAFATLVAPAVGGILYEKHGTYREVCLYSGALALLGALLLTLCSVADLRLRVRSLSRALFSRLLGLSRRLARIRIHITWA